MSSPLVSSLLLAIKEGEIVQAAQFGT